MVKNPLLMVGFMLLGPLVINQNVYAQGETTSTPATTATQQTQRTTVITPRVHEPRRIAGKSNLYCAGYIKYERFGATPQVVGAEGEP